MPVKYSSISTKDSCVLISRLSMARNPAKQRTTHAASTTVPDSRNTMRIAFMERSSRRRRMARYSFETTMSVADSPSPFSASSFCMSSTSASAWTSSLSFSLVSASSSFSASPPSTTSSSSEGGTSLRLLLLLIKRLCCIFASLFKLASVGRFGTRPAIQPHTFLPQHPPRARVLSTQATPRVQHLLPKQRHSPSRPHRRISSVAAQITYSSSMATLTTTMPRTYSEAVSFS